jgi:hypothetical protein
MGMFDFFKSEQQKQKEKEAREQREQEQKKLIEQRAILIRELTTGNNLPVLASAPIIAQKGEICHLSTPATLLKNKTVTTGYSGGYSGVSVRVAKGVSVRSGGSKGKAIRKTVTNEFSGQVVITNKRIVFVATQNGFSLPFNKMLSRTHYTDGYGLIKENGSYIFKMTENDLFDATLTGVLKKYLNA